MHPKKSDCLQTIDDVEEFTPPQHTDHTSMCTSDASHHKVDALMSQVTRMQHTITGLENELKRFKLKKNNYVHSRN